MIAINWTLGFTAARFWVDWGIPPHWSGWLEKSTWPFLAVESPIRFKRLLACGFIVLPLYLDSTNDLGRRYTDCLDGTVRGRPQPGT